MEEKKKVTRWDSWVSHPETNQGLLVVVDERGVMLHPGEISGRLSTDKVEELHSFLGDYLAAVPRKVTLSIRDVSPGESFEWLGASWKRDHSGLSGYTWCVGTDGTRLMLQNKAQVVVTRKGSQ